MNSSFGIVELSKAKSGGISQRVPMMQGQQQSSPGPQAWFKGRRDDETGEPIAIAEVYTIRFGVVPPSSGAGGTPLDTTFNSYAWVHSTVAGNVISTKVTIGYRTALTLTAESVNISIHDNTDAAFIPGGVPQEYSVTVQIAPGLRASFETPPTLQGETDIVNSAAAMQTGVVTLDATTGNARYPITPNAGVIACEVVVVGVVDPTSPCAVTATAMAGSVAAKTWNPGVNKGFVVLPPNTTYVELANVAGIEFFATLTWAVEG